MKRTTVQKILAAGLAASLCLTVPGCGNSRTSSQSTSVENASSEANSSAISAVGDVTSMTSDAEPVTNDDGSVSQDVYAMDTYMSLKAFGDNAEEAVAAGTKEIHRIDDLLSTGKKTSEISKINANAGGSLSNDTESLISRSLDLYKSTDGAFDIAIYPVMQLWGFPTKKYRVPKKSEINNALKLTDASKIQLDTASHRVSFAEKGMEIDLGGIAKGYTSARLMDVFKQHGVKSAIVSLGGNVETLGTKTDGSSWRVAIEDPDSTEDYLGVLETHDKAVITSGGYERYFKKNGKTYHHIIDPKTGYPADSGIHSSTIVSSDGTLADGLSTSLFIMGLDKAEEYWKAHSGEFDFVLETDDGKLYVTDGISGQFTSSRKVTVVHK